MTKFSETNGFATVQLVQLETISTRLRNRIWNDICCIISPKSDWLFEYTSAAVELKVCIAEELWTDFYAQKSSDISQRGYSFTHKQIHDEFFNSEWYHVYDSIEFILEEIDLWSDTIPDVKSVKDAFSNKINYSLERENAGYRIINGTISPITNKHEIEEIGLAISSGWVQCSEHIQTALDHLSNKEKPDYRNSVKESISAVESACKTVTDKHCSTLGEALKIIKKTSSQHPAFLDALNKLYGYTSDTDGIRHSLTDSSEKIECEDARFMLIICSAFCNWMKEKSVD